jgi:hypothetical protein
MSYRSDVMCVIYGDKEKMLALRTEERLKPEGVYKYFGEYFEVRESGTTQYLIMRIENVKWYDSQYDVSLWREFMRNALGSGLHFEFMRTGEDPTDVQHFTSPDAPEELLGLTKSPYFLL